MLIDVTAQTEETDLLPPMRLAIIPRVGELMAIEDTVTVNGNPTVRVRWFIVISVVHHVALYDEAKAHTGGYTRTHGVMLHLEYRHG